MSILLCGQEDLLARLRLSFFGSLALHHHDRRHEAPPAGGDGVLPRGAPQTLGRQG